MAQNRNVNKLTFLWHVFSILCMFSILRFPMTECVLFLFLKFNYYIYSKLLPIRYNIIESYIRGFLNMAKISHNDNNFSIINFRFRLLPWCTRCLPWGTGSNIQHLFRSSWVYFWTTSYRLCLFLPSWFFPRSPCSQACCRSPRRTCHWSEWVLRWNSLGPSTQDFCAFRPWWVSGSYMDLRTLAKSPDIVLWWPWNISKWFGVSGKISSQLWYSYWRLEAPGHPKYARRRPGACLLVLCKFWCISQVHKEGDRTAREPRGHRLPGPASPPQGNGWAHW